MSLQRWRGGNCYWRGHPEAVHRLRQDQAVLQPCSWRHPVGLSCLPSLSSPRQHAAAVCGGCCRCVRGLGELLESVGLPKHILSVPSTCEAAASPGQEGDKKKISFKGRVASSPGSGRVARMLSRKAPLSLPVRGWRGHGVPTLVSLWLGVSRPVVVGTPGERRVPKAGQSKALAAEREINYGHFAALQVTAKADVSPVDR